MPATDGLGSARHAPPGSATAPTQPRRAPERAVQTLPICHRMQAVERRAPAEIVQEAEFETTLAEHRDWVAAGRPGAVSHERAMAELLAEL